jgi:hypothetical protein
MIQDNDRYLDFNTFDSSQQAHSSRRIPEDSDFTARSSPETMKRHQLHEKLFNPLRAIRLLVSCHKSLVNTKASFKDTNRKCNSKILSQLISAYIDNLNGFKHNYYPIYFGMTDMLSKLSHKDSKMLFNNHDPLF